MTVLSKNQVVVAMSGGVDSSVAALLLKEKGMDVIGIAMKTHEERESSTGRSCCSASDINDARRVCQHLDIPFYSVNLTEEFDEQVITYFGREYGAGRTPNPCVECNDKLKFSLLLKKVRQLGAYYLATGHYAQKSRDRNGRYHLLKSKDQDKDQTYFLYGLGQEQLEHVLFPIGKYTKGEVREFAKAAGLKTAEKPESQEICFVPGNDYASFLEDRFPEFCQKGAVFVDEEGNELDENRGIHAYTIGQRRGLGISAGERLYVTEILSEEKQVVLGKKESLLKTGLIAGEVRWVNREMATSGMKVEVKVRHRRQGAEAILWIVDETTVKIEFKEPEGAVTPGQAAVFYYGEEVLGGGKIEKGLS